eukprot:249248_1
MAYSTKERKEEDSSVTENTKHDTHDYSLSPSRSVATILDNALYEIDPLLLIRICSFLDMLSAMRFQTVSLRISKFLKKNIQLQSLYETSTDYVIDQALHMHDPKRDDHEEEEEEKEEDVVSIYSELVYRFPNNFQYDHYILLETDKNIFAPFHRIKRLHLKILPPKATQAVFNPSSSYFAAKQQQEEEEEVKEDTVEEEEEATAETTRINTNYLLLNSAASRFAASRAPITPVETSIYSRSIFAYFDCYFGCIDELMIEFSPNLFVCTFLTFNMPQILNKIRRLSLIKVVENEDDHELLSAGDVYCHECASLLQYTRNLQHLTFNFPLSSDFYPIINDLSSLRVMHRIEQPYSFSVGKTATHSAYSQNIATLNSHTTLISNVKLQESLIHYFIPCISSLHLHGSRGVQSVLSQFMEDETLSNAVVHKNKVFFGLNEVCIHCSHCVYEFVTKYMAVVPQLTRLQIIFGANSSIYDLELMLNHFAANCVLNLSYNDDGDNLLQYYFNYYIYYGFNLSNCASKLRCLYLCTKKTTNVQNYQLLVAVNKFFENTIKTCKHFALLYCMLFVEYSHWNTDDLMASIQFIAKNQDVFGRHCINYRIVMPISNIAAASAAAVNDKYHVLSGDDDAADIDNNSLKGIASYVKQTNVGVLDIQRMNGTGQRIVVVQKITAAAKNTHAMDTNLYQKYNTDHHHEEDDRQLYKDKITQNVLQSNGHLNDDAVNANATQWINQCFYCDLLK